MSLISIKEVDKILKNRKPDEVAKMLQHEVASGRDRIVDLVAQATSPTRLDRPSDVPTLNKAHYLDAYTDGMKYSAPKAKNTIEQGNIHRASTKLLDHVKDIPPMLHRSTVQFNNSQLAKKTWSQLLSSSY